MLTAPFCLRLLLCLACLVCTVLAQTTYRRLSYAPIGTGVLEGDFNRDGKPDLLGSDFAGKLTVFLNKGDGTFGTRVTTQAGRHISLVKADFNRDGRTDLVACPVQNNETGETATQFALWSGNGAGTFAVPRRFNLGGNCRAVVQEDFNQDGKQDLAAIWRAINPDFSPNNGIAVFFGDGAGNVSNSVTTDHISAMNQDGQECAFSLLVAGNYDRSGSPDVVIATQCPTDFESNTVVFGKGTGTGHFGFTTTYDSFSGSHPANEKEDVDQDGRLDLVVNSTLTGGHSAWGSSLVMFINRDAGGIPQWEQRTVQGYGGESSCQIQVVSGAAVDLNGDAIKDAAYGEVNNSDCGSGTESYRLAIKLGRADGTYGAPQKFTFGSRPRSLTSGDFDRDGRIDLAVAAEQSVQIFLNRTSIATCTANSTLRTVKICAPSTLSGSTMRLRANTTSGGPVTGMKVYLDGKEVFSTPNETINRNLTVPTGSHRITVRAWDSQGSFSSTKTVTR